MANQHFGVRTGVRWDPAVEAYFTACFGVPRLAAMSAALARPSLTPTLRVNTLRSNPQELIQKLQRELWKQQQKDHHPNHRYTGQHHGQDMANARRSAGLDGEVSSCNELPITATNKTSNSLDGGDAAASKMAGVMVSAKRTQPPTDPTTTTTVRLHPRVPAVAVMFGRGPCDVDDYSPGLPEVVINRFAGEAVLKGAHVYAPGILAASAGIAAGDLVVVSAALERPVGHNDGQGADAHADQDHLSIHGDGVSVRLAVGISRGAKVEPDGSVPLSWARQPPPPKLQRSQRSSSPRQGQMRQRQQERRRRQQGGARGAECDEEPARAGGMREAVKPRTEAECMSRHGSSSSHGSSNERCSGDSINDSWAVLGSDISKPSSSSSSSSCSSCSRDSERSSWDNISSTGVQEDKGGNSSGSISRRSERAFLGLARAVVGRRAMFRAQEGLVLQMERRLYDVPSCNGLLRGEVMLQALPSIIAAQVLNPRPGTSVLDMCAAPGGKTTLLAALLGDQGRIVALDRTAAKVAEIRSLARDLGVHCVEAYQADAKEAVLTMTAAAAAAAAAAAEQPMEEKAAAAGAVGRIPSPPVSLPSAAPPPSSPRLSAIPSAAPSSATPSSAAPSSAAPSPAAAGALLLGPPPYPAGTFDYILLDPPCTALGLRPRLLHSWNLPQLRAMAAYQRALMHTAVRLLAPGGEMVYCTCTINPDENEANVAWALDRFSGSLQLLPAEPLVGLTGLTGADPETGSRWLNEQEAAMVQRFDPGLLFPGRMMGLILPPLPLSQPPAHPQAKEQEPGFRCDDDDDDEDDEDEEELPWVDDVMGFFIARLRKVS
ncbi:hypothetical protein Vretifemale_11036 [Volvox reticuliferus]|uniref:SAM-dependent MTase RsmB/NOP-type domain-containing protein n=1 Tax=Volvox reticuliferus TaxID=1737510 RepID=A0A8J4FN80_9CHLO|nr:hypothetical protein Vretifemale_11036 [Volvox reticuliferus]